MTDQTPAPRENKWRTIALVLLPIFGIALVILAIYVVRHRESSVVTAVYVAGQDGAATVNTGDVIDATNPSMPIEPRLGYRYKVFIEDESDDRSSGIARLSGRATFIPNGRRGQTALVDITRVRERVIDAVLVEVLSQVDMPPKAPRLPFQPRPGDASAHVVDGAEMDVIISEASSKNPDTEGVAKVAGLVVFVNGATTIGERVNIRIIERRERIAFAEPTGKPAGTDPLPVYEAPVRREYQPRPGDPAVVGAEMDVIILEESEKNPGLEGIAKIGGLVVAVKGATTVGERVNIRITDRRERIAFAELTGKPAGDGPLPVYEAAPVRGSYQPRPGDPAVVGAEMDVIILEESEKNPGLEGIAKIGGLVVAVKGATTVGERVNIRITDRRERIAFAELTGKPAGDGPLPVYEAAPVRGSYQPRPGDPAVVGAEMDVIILEESEQNYGLEGIAKINGLIVAVKGATNVGERVNIRITERRARIAFAELTGKPIGNAPLHDGTTGQTLRKLFTPSPEDPAGHVIAGAELDLTILEPSKQNPGMEGVAKVNGLVVFVEGATDIGKTVRARITARRERVAFAEVIPGAPVAAAPVVEATPAPVEAAPEAPVEAPATAPAEAAPAAL